MSKYVIHACPERMWYVDNYLVPSMKSQGISNIVIRCDNNKLGNLESCMEIFGSMMEDDMEDGMDDGDSGSWHLQDDVIICNNFRKLTEQYDYGIVCGFTATASAYHGTVKPDHMWWSFPCIRIPDAIAKECSEWFYSFAKGYAKYYEWVHMNKCDDNFFREFLKSKYPYIDIINLIPNLVDHIDFLLGGSVVNQYRGENQVRSVYFKDQHLIHQLSDSIRGNR